MNRRTFLRTGAATAVVAPWLLDPPPNEPQPGTAARFISNPNLPTLLPAAQWPGTPLDADGRFQNHEFPHRTPGGQVLKWMLQRNPQREEKNADTFRLPVIEGHGWLSGAGDVVVWLGHASFFVRLDGVSLLIDPIFGAPPFGKRLSALPLDPARFTGLDYVLVSHAHYDHCDKDALQQLARQNPGLRLLTGLGMPELLRKWLPTAEVQAAGWFQQFRTPTDARLRISFVPGRHWSNRSLSDVNETLWGGFVLQASSGRSVYFNGDSGYGSHYRQIGRLFPGLEVALLGAGAYAPRWFMAPNHQDPQQAVQAFHDLGAKILVPMHYGTFDLSDEPPGEPVRVLQGLAQAGHIRGQLRVLGAGEVLALE